MPTWRRSHKNSGPKKKNRRLKALNALEEDLKKGFMNNGQWIEYDDQDKKRISKEIEKLKQRV